jgi:glycosyltransferase involved in cell wall biosynthesis
MTRVSLSFKLTNERLKPDMPAQTTPSPSAIGEETRLRETEVEITLIVPVYNEDRNIVHLIEEIKNKIDHLHQIVIIFDHEDDTTLRQRNALLAIDPTIAFVRNTKGGVISAFRTGFSVARGQYVVPIMADLSDTPSTIPEMYRKICEGYDLVIGSRYCEGGCKIGGPYIKYLLSLIANRSLHWLTGIPTHDMTNAFVMYRKDVLDNIHVRSSGGFEITMELIAKAYILGYRITEVPTINRERATGKSNFKLLDWIGNYLYWYFYIFIYSIVRKLNAHYVRDTRPPSS